MLTQEEKTARAKYPLFHTPPDDDVFEEMRAACIDEWHSMEGEYPRAIFYEEQLPYMLNILDNFSVIFLQFDGKYQKEIVSKLSEKTKGELRKRLVEAEYDDGQYLENIGL